MVDFDKLLDNESKYIETDPVKIFERSDKESGKEYLRPPQKTVLENWKSDFFEKKDVVVKLHTGLGKTLLGLLMLQSRLNSGLGPAIFLCPNRYLVAQTIREAKAFGIKTVHSFQSSNLPLEFVNSEAILVTTCHKLFNGMSVFGVSGSGRDDPVQVGSLVMDDAHTCIDIIKASFSITVKRKDHRNFYEKLWEIFKESMNRQRVGTCTEIEEGEDSILAVPFWTWHDKKDRVLEVLRKHKDNDAVRFAWNFLKDRLDGTTCVFSGKELQISPRLIPVDMIPSFTNAKQRVFLSATLNEDTFLVKDLDVDPESVICPLSLPATTHIGERLILIPQLLDHCLERDSIIDWITRLAKNYKEFGTASIVPSLNLTRDWTARGGKIADASNLEEKIGEIRECVSSKTCENVTILLNTYDGVDLPDGLCRVLCLDSMPSHTSLFERYSYRMRKNSSTVNKQMAQRLEQGMGRAIRGISDWCIVVLTGSRLTRFVSEHRMRQFLSNETQKQIEIAEDLAGQIRTEKDSMNAFALLVTQVLERNDSWKEYYHNKMQTTPQNIPDPEFLEIAKLERKAELQYQQGRYTAASSSIQAIIDKPDTNDAGWYLQLMATYLYPHDKSASMVKQESAFSKNNDLHRPEHGTTNNTLPSNTNGREAVILEWIRKQKNTDLILNLADILDDVSFGVDSNQFEAGIEKMGNVLGFASQRPEQENGKGSDNLWNVGSKQYWLISCKNKVHLDRQYVSKREANQLGGAIDWFKHDYDECTAKPILIHPSKTLAADAFIKDDVYVIRNENLCLLKENIRKFYSSLVQYDPNDISKDTILSKLRDNKLDIFDLTKTYLEKIEQIPARD